jgi:transposase-like protein
MEAYMRIIARHQRCVHCHSTHTRKNGFRYRKKRSHDKRIIRVVRWFCLSCKKTFSDTKSIHRFAYAINAARHYFVGRASYRNTARQLHINHMTAYTHVQAVCQRTKMPWELSRDLTPQWSGYLLVDSNQIIVNNRPAYMLFSVDAATRDIPSLILSRQQTVPDWQRLFTTLTDVKYPFKAFISDGYQSILTAVKTMFPRVPHQICLKHFYDETYRFFRYCPHRIHMDKKHTNLFMNLLHSVLFARSFGHYQGELNHLLNHPKLTHPIFKDHIQRLLQYPHYILPHFFDQNIPRTTNIIENVIGQLDLKINPSIKYGSYESAWNTIKSIVAWYRFKKFSNCRFRYRHHNGKAPLELAGVKLKKTSWIYQAIRQL